MKYGLGIGQGYEGNKEIRTYIKNNKKSIFKHKDKEDLHYDLLYTRNSAVHGYRSQGIQIYVEQQGQFEELFHRA